MTSKALALTLGGIVVVGGAGVLLIVLKGKSKSKKRSPQWWRPRRFADGEGVRDL